MASSSSPHSSLPISHPPFTETVAAPKYTSLMQRPTCTWLRVRSPSDAHVIFHAVSLGLLPIVTRRLDTEERRAIMSGCVFVWEERGSTTEATGLGIERWTDSIRWGPSRVRDEFLYYHEKGPEPTDIELGSDSDNTLPTTPSDSSRSMVRDNLIKQTYSVFVDTPRGRRKWHLIAYFTQESLDNLRTVDDIPLLANLHPPPGKYKSARSAKTRPHRPLTYNGIITPLNSYSSALPSPNYPFAQRGDIVRYPPPPLNTHAQRSVLNPSIGPSPGLLAPLAYLETLPPTRRHPFDEKVLMTFTGGLY